MGSLAAHQLAICENVWHAGDPPILDRNPLALGRKHSSSNPRRQCMKEKHLSRLVLLGLVAMGSPLIAQQAKPAQATKQPNILVIFGDDVGYWNLSAYSHGVVGYKTPNI